MYKRIIKQIKKNPNSSAATEKIKSEYESGKFLLTSPSPSPLPKKPPLLKDLIDFKI